MKGRRNGGRKVIQTLPPTPIPGTAMGLPNTVPTVYDHFRNYVRTARIAFWVGLARLMVQAFGYNVYHRQDVTLQSMAANMLSNRIKQDRLRRMGGFPVSHKLRAAAGLLDTRIAITEANPWRRLPSVFRGR